MTDDKLDKFTRYGWRCNETNLNTLPVTAPQGAKDLAKWLTLEGRRSSLQEYVNCVQPDGRIHGKFWHIGAWTQRMSHSNPNQANIASVFEGTPTTAVEDIKHRYDARIRELFEGDEWLVGTDADAIQLCVLTHYTKSETYRKAIVEGDKKLGTDIHSINMKALGPVCKDRDTAKVFIYSWILGAALPKTASILDCSIPQAKEAVDKFVKSIDGLSKLRSVMIPRDAARGYFIGLDGRRVPCSSEHHMLAGYLQNGEAVIMKMAALKWSQFLDSVGANYKFVDFVHDEWQTSVIGSREDAEYVGLVQRKALASVGRELGMFCPITGSSNIGRNWCQTH